MIPVRRKELREVSVLLLFASLFVIAGTALVVYPDATGYPDDLPEVAFFPDDIIQPDYIMNPNHILPPHRLPDPGWIVVPMIPESWDTLSVQDLELLPDYIRYTSRDGVLDPEEIILNYQDGYHPCTGN